MGLPDTSPTPKKDSMGMDYVPVYADEQTDDGSLQTVTPPAISSGIVTLTMQPRSVHLLQISPIPANQINVNVNYPFTGAIGVDYPVG